MEREEREQLIARYKDGYRVVSEALLKITPEELDTQPAPGKWTARQIVHHLGDSEMTAAVRFRLLVAEDKPSIKGYDQDRFSERLHYERSHEASLELFRAARAATAELMACLSEADWLREGTHSEVGRFGLDTWLRIYAPHAHRHADQIRVARGSLKK
jgi:DinB superfamily